MYCGYASLQLYGVYYITIHCQVNKITQEIAYPEFIKDDEKLNEFYHNVSDVP